MGIINWLKNRIHYDWYGDELKNDYKKLDKWFWSTWLIGMIICFVLSILGNEWVENNVAISGILGIMMIVFWGMSIMAALWQRNVKNKDKALKRKCDGEKGN